jgi:hypothetical protein
MKNENKIIDFIINKLSLIDWTSIELVELKKEFDSFELKDFNELIPKMEYEYKLITRLNSKGQTQHKTAKLTDFGNDVKNKGGWTLFLEKQKEFKEKQEFKENLELEHIIAENEKLEHERDLRQLQIDLANSNIKSNKVSSKISKVSMYVGIITLIALVTQIGISLYLNKQQTKTESLEEELKSKTKELTVSHHQIDSLKILLDNQNHTKIENEEKIETPKKD